MNATLPNVDRSAPVKDTVDTRKDTARSEKDDRANRFDKVIDKVRDDKRIPDRKEASNKKEEAKSASTETKSDKGESEASETIKDLLKKAGAGSSDATGADNTAAKGEAAASQKTTSGAELLSDELLAKQLVVNAVMTAEQKAGLQMSSVTGLANMTGSTATSRDGTMAQVLNALSSKELKALNGEADVKSGTVKTSGATQGQGTSELGNPKTPNAGLKLEGSGAINLPQTEGNATGAKQLSADFLLKQGKSQPDASASQAAGKPAVGGEVKVVSLETHLPPAELGRPAQQVASALSKQLSQAASAANTAQELAAQAADAKAAKPVKSLEIQLRPDNLGAVRANIQMRGGELEISLVTNTREAADMLKGDRQALARVLQDAGYRTETQNITVNFKEEVSDQMRQPGQNQERFGRGENSERDGNGSDTQQSWEDQPHADHAGVGQNEADAHDIRSGIYL
ncbi:chemotaxis protein MotD [Pseudovibrio ascidiaceicola]|uniref:Chemotaxis protein MotD n=1 Tax=Pseudovibrio ascidiaceicola TaxID=285279 RepID=A0A1I4BBB5_9HYPH|nr:flagellar hook-length control protein FliK [Pseudovibrio ascidiaceicola]SFK65640.1 chemotaxis protein MotD [Pseudovibrio ascidiaceicola]